MTIWLLFYATCHNCSNPHSLSCTGQILQSFRLLLIIRRTSPSLTSATYDRCTWPVVSAYAAWHHFARNNDVRRLTKQPKLTAIIQSCQLTLFWHIMLMDDNVDAKRILLASPPADWRWQPGRPRITWLSTVQQHLKHHHLTLHEAADLAQNCHQWRMMSTYGATES